MVELSNTTVHTSFSYKADGVVITGTAIVNKDNKVESIDNGNIVKNDKNVCNRFSASIQPDGTLAYEMRGVDVANIASVIPMLEILPQSITADLAKQSK